MKKNSLRPEEEKEKKKLEDIVDQAIKSDNFKDVNRLIADSIDQAIDFTRSSISRLFTGSIEKKPYSIQEDDTIINQSPKAFRRMKNLNRLSKLSIGFHLLMTMGLLIDGLNDNSGNFVLLVFWIIPALILSFLGLRKSKKLKEQEIRFRKYRREIGNSTVIPVHDLAVVVGKSKEFVVEELREFISKDFFRQGRLVENEEIFILDGKTYKLYKEHKLEEAQNVGTQMGETFSVHSNLDSEVATKAKYYVTELTKIAEDMEPSMQNKLTRLLTTIQKIFAHVKQYPGDADQLNKFIEYYLPTTLKLCHSYESMEDVNIGDHVKESMREIEQTLDTINEAFGRLLDNLYEEQLIDLSSDISVLKTMLRQEGLLEDDFTIRR
ncbi:MAG: 5-bromo-4-chloroindolyl phosphate hydrolysis family protein [Tissierellia bacterium]|nr:5-bromo-4-chloroindolyl phosphate hydrolysis family protein [Tissierellia bacterium]